jgi:hypothetical protein
MCAVFIAVSICYFNLHNQINVTVDITNPTKQQQIKAIKDVLFWAMILCAGLVLWSGYDLLYTEGASKFLGAKGCGCNSGLSLKSDSAMSGLKSAMEAVQPYTGIYSLSDF